MSPNVALIVWLLCLLALLLFDPAAEPKTSPALWVPVIWMIIASSRLPSQWLGSVESWQSMESAEEGNPLDRSFYLVLILLAIVILVSRSLRWPAFFGRNLALTVFFGFGLVSILWSDFTFISFKRWFRDLGDYVIVLLILSDERPLEAVRTVLRRLCYVVIPLSLILIKYYASLGMHYNYWSGAPEFVGVTTSKNTLGGLCVVSGLTFVWDTATRWSSHDKHRIKQIMLLNAVFFAMTVWLLVKSNSATSRVCLAVGCLMIIAAYTKPFKRNQILFKALIPAVICLAVLQTFGFGMTETIARALGRDPTLTGRTNIWNAVLSQHTNPILGTGYESFWLGPRVWRVWAMAGHQNEAHNGYIEVYLNLGMVGLFLLVLVLIAAHRKICKNLEARSGLGPLGAATWAFLLLSSLTEAVFRGGTLWMLFLISAFQVPQSTRANRGSTDENPPCEAPPFLLREDETLLDMTPLQQHEQKPSSADV